MKNNHGIIGSINRNRMREVMAKVTQMVISKQNGIKLKFKI